MNGFALLALQRQREEGRRKESVGKGQSGTRNETPPQPANVALPRDMRREAAEQKDAPRRLWPGV